MTSPVSTIPPKSALAIPILLAGLTLFSFAASVEDLVKDIRARYNSVESAKLRSSSIKFEAQDEPLGGTCTLYTDRLGSILKVHLSYTAGDHGGSEEFFYYHDGTLFFAYASDAYWRFTGKTLPNGEGETLDTTTEHRVYYANGATIRHLFKEASSPDSQNLSALLAKAVNQPSSDSARAAQLTRHGLGLPQVKTPADILLLFSSPEE